MRPAVVLKERASATEVLLKMELPADSSVFIDHFPGYPVLAGVFQIDWAIGLGAEYFDFSPPVARNFRVKFRRVIGPTNNLLLRLQLDQAAGVLSFEYRNEAEVASFGRFQLGKSPMRICAVVPTYNHYRALGGIVRTLRGEGLPVFVIDDGSSEPAAKAIAALQDIENAIVVHRVAPNRGKGAAMRAGFRLASAAGFTHALQIDADGQHSLKAVPHMLGLSRRNPDALVLGSPIFDASMPAGRRIGRWITHFWVALETLRWDVIDSMCGLRLYPLAPVAAIATANRMGDHMEFDTEILVRAIWRGIPVLRVAVDVCYPKDNFSNFDLLRDNCRISGMHARLFFSMLWHFPGIIANRAEIAPIRRFSGEPGSATIGS